MHQAGATVDEIMAVLKLCVLHGFDACSLGVPVLAEEPATSGWRRTPESKNDMLSRGLL
jgi:hypothetical protein